MEEVMKRPNVFNFLVNLLRTLKSIEMAHASFWKKAEKFQFLPVIFSPHLK